MAGSKSNQKQSRTDLSLGLLIDLAGVVDAIGTPHFYNTLAKSIAKFLDSERYLAIRYARYAKPEFLANAAMTKQAVESYMLNYYRIDPILRLVRDGNPEQVITFDQLKRNGADTLFYDEMFRTADIHDELVFLLPTVGGVWAAICVDRSSRYFSQKDISKAKQVFPMVDKLHSLHVTQSVFGSVGGYLNDSQIALLVVDTDNTPQFKNEKWMKQVDTQLEDTVINLSSKSSRGSENLGNRIYCHWEPLDRQNAVAPNGTAVVIEEISPGYVDLTSDDLVTRFAKKHDLTQRELQIVGQIIQGQPATRIAENLKVSVGTIRNHKHRLYFKLDITTERELFCMIFEFIQIH